MVNAPKYGGNLPVGPGSCGGKTQDKPPGLGPLQVAAGRGDAGNGLGNRVRLQAAALRLPQE